MGKFRDESEDNAARRAAELDHLDKDLLGPNWNPAVGMLALTGCEAQREWRPQMPEDSEKLEPGFVVRIRVLASGI